ncbi:hypothetical protein HU200_020577 [Digitaria exilis]|uniref:Uncharacterized protein n=1 Tax=Digitaria exilis TaxID=1010633 RepID=A0A835F257_9POAL|nr:hypothetical protein HU200_020577 [Digitaria exilis]
MERISKKRQVWSAILAYLGVHQIPLGHHSLPDGGCNYDTSSLPIKDVDLIVYLISPLASMERVKCKAISGQGRATAAPTCGNQA